MGISNKSNLSKERITSNKKIIYYFNKKGVPSRRNAFILFTDPSI